MKRICLFLLIIIIILLFGCTSKNSPEPETIKILKEMKIDGQSDEARDYIREWYDEILAGFGQDKILKSARDNKAIAEFRVVCNITFLGYVYYSLHVFKDGTGSFKYMVHYTEDFSEGEMMVDETVNLSEEQVTKLLKVIEVNKFWSIPSTHPDEDIGCDGTSVFVEGYYDGQTHFINMWEPEQKHGIFKIHEAFAYFSETIKENPLN